MGYASCTRRGSTADARLIAAWGRMFGKTSSGNNKGNKKRYALCARTAHVVTMA